MYYRCQNCNAANERKATVASLGPCDKCKCFTLVRAERARIITDHEAYRSQGGYYVLNKEKQQFFPDV